MTRNELLQQALFDTGGEVQGIAFRPLSAPARLLLTTRGNPMFGSSIRDLGDDFNLGEILHVLTLFPDERKAAVQMPQDQWEQSVRLFICGLPDKAIEKFRDEYLLPAFERFQAAAFESEEPGKPVTSLNPQTSPITSKEATA
jgi:hypothetical protein